jgi:hypothetical protein
MVSSQSFTGLIRGPGHPIVAESETDERKSFSSGMPQNEEAAGRYE